MGKYTLSQIAEFIKNGLTVKQTKEVEGCPITRIETISNGFIDFDSVGYANISSMDYKEWLLKKGDILISHINSEKHLGKCAIFEDDKELIHGMNLLNFRSKNNVISKYLFFYFKTNIFKKELLKFMKKSVNQASFSISDFKNIEINLPSLDQQKQIAKTLDKAQKLIDLRKESIAKLDELAKSIFIDMFGDPVSNPKGWEVKKIADLGKVQTGNTPPRAEADNYGNYLEWIKSDNILRDKIGITEAREYLSQKGAKKGRIAEKGSLLFTCIAGSMLSIGNLGNVDRTVAFNQQINSLTPINNNSLYLYFLFTLSKQVFEESSTKSMKIMVNKSTFEGLIFPVAPIELQNKFASIIEKIEEQKSLYEKELEKLEDNFQALLQQSFKE